MHEPRCLDVTEAGVCLLADKIINLGIRGHLCAATRAGPILGGTNKLGANSGLPVIDIDKPAFEIANIFSFAVLDVGPNARFEKPGQPSAAEIGNGHKLRIRMLDNIHHLGFVIVLTRLIPQQMPQAKPFGEVTFRKRSDGEFVGCH